MTLDKTTDGQLQGGASPIPFELGATDWIEITQSMVTQFGTATLDPDPMHVEPDWAAANSPYGGTILFGFQTLAMLSYFGHVLFSGAGLTQAYAPDRGHLLNYGLDSVRFTAPVRVGKRIRAVFGSGVHTLDDAQRERFAFDVRVEIEDEPKPALSARWIWLWVPRAGVAAA